MQALEPLVAVLLQRIMGDTDRHSTLMYISFLPIAAGIGVASTGDLKFSWAGEEDKVKLFESMNGKVLPKKI